MAKIPFSKFETKINTDVLVITHLNSKGEEINYEVRYYLPIADKMDLVSRIINLSIDQNGFYNPIRVKIFTVLEVIYAYTNLSFTAKQKEDPLKLYDLLISSGIAKNVIENIKEDDWKEIQETILMTMDNIYKYKNSAMGIMEMITSDYSNLDLDAKRINESLSNQDNLKLLKEVLSKMG